MVPFPIPPATVSQILQLIVDLDAPLPPDLISRPLLQRHRFLAIAIDDPAQYLAWPGGGGAETVPLLKTFHTPHDLAFTAQYSADPESLDAHVHITNAEDSFRNEFRLIFKWDPVHAWQYHNIAPMPFPSNSYSNFSDALGIFQHDFLPEPSYVVSIASGDEEDDDSYWNSYGQDNGGGPPKANPKLKPHTPLNSEDAYWARYSSIQGSADSTVPSPMPTKRTFGEEVHGSDRIFVASDSLQPNPTELYNPLEPPSPNSLARRLANISKCPPSPPIEDEEDTCTDSSTTSPSNEAPGLEMSPDRSPSASTSQFSTSDYSPSTDESDLALRQTIQGLYRLWKTDQQRKGTNSNLDAFLSVVQNSIQA